MSCKLLRDCHELPAVPLFAAEAPRSTCNLAQPWHPHEDTAGQTSHEELVRLRQRVTELETLSAKNTETARAAAFAEGERAGHERAAAAARPVMDKLAATIADVSTLKTRIRSEAEHELVTLSLAIARRILRRELSVDPDAVQGIVRAALDKLQSRDILRVRVSPGHEDSVRRCLAAAHASSVELLSDPALRPGDILVETSRGNLDASIETQLSEIERGFSDRLR